MDSYNLDELLNAAHFQIVLQEPDKTYFVVVHPDCESENGLVQTVCGGVCGIELMHVRKLLASWGYSETIPPSSAKFNLSHKFAAPLNTEIL